jgi:hypothetical protein
VSINRNDLDIHRNIQGEKLTNFEVDSQHLRIDEMIAITQSKTATGYVKNAYYANGCSSAETLVSITSLGVCTYTSGSIYGYYFIATVLNTTSSLIAVHTQYYSDSSCSRKVQVTSGYYSLYGCSSSNEYFSKQFSTTYPTTISGIKER